MTNQEIMDLVSCFDQSTAQTMKVTREGFTLELTREAAIGAPAPVPTACAPAPVAAPAVEEGCTVTAPWWGPITPPPIPSSRPL